MILSDYRWVGQHGIGRYAVEVLSRLEGVLETRLAGKPMTPLDPLHLALMVTLQKRGDVFYSPGPSAPLASKIPFCLTIHDLMFLDVPGEASPLKQFYFNTLIRKMSQQAAIIFTVSHYTRQRLEDWLGRTDIIVAPNGVSSSFKAQNNHQRMTEEYFLYVGNRRPHKNIDTLFQAFACFVNHSTDNKGFSLKLTGRPDDATTKSILALKIENHVEFLGANISETDLASKYAGARALIIPSLDEGFGLPALEAMSCGTPVICSDRGGLKEVVGDAGLIIDPCRHESITEAMTDLIASDELRDQLVKKGFLQSAEFNWDVSASIIQRAINDIRP